MKNQDNIFFNKYMIYKNKYTKLKYQTGSAPELSDLSPNVLSEHMNNAKAEILLARTSKEAINAFSIKYSNYNSTFAPDIDIIPNNFICNNQLGCNKFILHTKIIDILQRKRQGIPIPANDIPVKPLLYPILNETIETNNSDDAEFLVSIGVIIRSMMDDLFKGKGLTQVYIPSSVTRIGIGSFANNLLTTINIPQNVRYIGPDAFNNNHLSIVNLPQSLNIIEDGAFNKNSIQNIIIPNNVTHIGERAFQNNLLTSLTIPQSVISIGSYAFYNNRLTDVNIPKNVLRFGSHVFRKNPINNVTMPTIPFYYNQSEELFDNITGIKFIRLN